jgi:hypothetical protein
MAAYKNIKVINFLLTFILSMGMVSCKEEYDEVFPETPDERVQKVLDEYNQMLIDAPHGWKARLYTGTGAGYFYYFDFDESGRVKMVSDFNQSTAEESMDGTWKIKALQRPTLSFDTYSYVHLPADPDGDVNSGGDGKGLVSDFEFAWERTNEDTIVFQGIQHATEVTFIKATEQEAAAVLNGAVAEMFLNTSSFSPDNEVLQLHLPNNQTIPVAINVDAKIFGLQYPDIAGDSIVMAQSPFTFTVDGILLKSPLSYGEFTFDKLIWDNEKELFVVLLGNEEHEVTNPGTPFIFNLSTPLAKEMGHKYQGIHIPENVGMSPLPGQSGSFTALYTAAAESMQTGLYTLTLREINFNYDPLTNTMQMDVVVSQTSGGIVTRFLAQFVYSYAINEEGIIDYAFMGANENGWAIYYDMETILNHIDFDTFKMEYVAGVFNLLGTHFSQEDQEFYFSGYTFP